eukprot:GHVN01038116.1.p1 GENE.GHVN01038116.1~~GHVN01038116.1.p1  ORF type:complete len:444 (-),score=128.66 GHVN01038116.1:188-1519(-)
MLEPRPRSTLSSQSRHSHYSPRSPNPPPQIHTPSNQERLPTQDSHTPCHEDLHHLTHTPPPLLPAIDHSLQSTRQRNEQKHRREQQQAQRQLQLAYGQRPIEIIRYSVPVPLKGGVSQTTRSGGSEEGSESGGYIGGSVGSEEGRVWVEDGQCCMGDCQWGCGGCNDNAYADKGEQCDGDDMGEESEEGGGEVDGDEDDWDYPHLWPSYDHNMYDPVPDGDDIEEGEEWVECASPDQPRQSHVEHSRNSSVTPRVVRGELDDQLNAGLFFDTTDNLWHSTSQKGILKYVDAQNDEVTGYGDSEEKSCRYRESHGGAGYQEDNTKPPSPNHQPHASQSTTRTKRLEPSAPHSPHYYQSTQPTHQSRSPQQRYKWDRPMCDNDMPDSNSRRERRLSPTERRSRRAIPSNIPKPPHSPQGASHGEHVAHEDHYDGPLEVERKRYYM